MTTFQVIIDSILRALSGVIPLSYAWASRMEEHFLHFSSKLEVEFLMTLVLGITFLVYFRFDWLGLFTGGVKLITQPRSFRPENRTLDQEVVLFLAAVSIPLLLLRYWLFPAVESSEFFSSPITYGVLFVGAAGMLRFAFRWNKRIKGLNHLRVFDATTVFLVSLLSLHPAFPLALVFWLGLSVVNFHYEAIFKYSMLLLGIQVFAHLIQLLGDVSMQGAFRAMGILNGVAAVVVAFTVLWMTIENLQKNMSENTFRSFQWLNVIAAFSSFALHFLKG